MPGRLEHDLGTRGRPAMCVRRGVIKTKIGLHLDDPSDDALSRPGINMKTAADQVPRHFDSRPREELTPEALYRRSSASH